MTKVCISIFFGSVSFFLLTACTSKSSSSNTSPSLLVGEVKVDGSSTVYPVTEAVAEEFRVVQPDVKVMIGISGTGGGFKKFGRGETDINNASRPIKDQEAEVCNKKNIKYIKLSIAYDGLVILVNKKNTWVNHFTVAELKKIWEPAAQRKINRWNQIRSEWPDAKFNLYGPGIASGTYDYFTAAIVGESGSSRGDYTASEDDNVLVQGVAGDKNAIGFFGLAYYEENKDKLRLLAVDNGRGPVKPNAETVQNGTYAPLSRPIFIYVSNVATQRPEVVEFVNFYLNKITMLVPDVGYVALPVETYKNNIAMFQAFCQSSKIN